MEEQVKLRLHGLDKEWVRSASGEWVDLATLNQPVPIQEQDSESGDELTLDQPTKRKWWKFWSR